MLYFQVGELQLCAHCVVMTGIVGVLFIFLGPILLPTMPRVGMAALIAGGKLSLSLSLLLGHMVVGAWTPTVQQFCLCAG